MERNSVSYHPNWENNIKETTTKLIIGSMPPKRLCLNEKNNEDIDYYYGSKDNYFWNIMNYMDKKDSYNDLRDYKLKDVLECKNILNKYNIGILDIIVSCIHNDGLAADKSLLDIKPIDLISILNNNKNIDTLFCTSEYVKDLLGIYYANKITYNKDNKSGEIIFEGIDKVYKFYILYSPTKRVVFNMFNNKRDILIKNYSLLFK